MSRRSAPGSLLGALFIIGFVGWVLSQIWVYLVIGGAVGVIGWIGFVLSRTMRLPSSTPPRLVAAEAARSAPPPDNRFRPVIAVDPGVFEDSVLAEAAALKVFAAWTQQLPMAPRDPSPAVRSLELRLRQIGRLVSDIAERKVVWREVAYAGPTPSSGSPTRAETIDPWAMTPDTLKRSSQYVANCDRCSSRGSVNCGNCAGTTKATCADCNGAGKMYGYASNGSRRLLNCKACKGKAEIRCTACAKGQVQCPSCRGSGRLEKWLDVIESVRSDVQVEPDGELTRAFAWGTDGSSAARTEIEADAKIACELTVFGVLSRAEIARLVPGDWLNANWERIQPKLQAGERIRSQTFWLLDVPSIELSYGLANSSPTVLSFEGRRMLAPPRSVDRQFLARAQRIRLIRYVVLGLSIAVPVAYLMRGSYFWSPWIAGLAIAVAGLGLAVDGFMRQATLGRHSARGWAIGVGSTALLACACAIAAEPSARTATRYVASGQLEKARTELSALGKPNLDSHARAWADLRLAEAMKITDPVKLGQLAVEIPETLPQRATANQRLSELLSQAVSLQISGKNAAAAERLLADTAPALPNATTSKPVMENVADLRARVHDEEFEECSTDVCRWKAAFAANRSVTSRGRQQRLSTARAKIVDVLTTRPSASEPALSRIQRIDAIAEAARSVADVDGDAEMLAMSRDAEAWTTDERAKLAIVGAPRDIAAVLMRIPADSAGSTLASRYSNVASYCSIRGGRCVGVYIVGSDRAGRVLNDGAHAAATLHALCAAIGHKAELPDPPKNLASGTWKTSNWHEGSVGIAARWRGGDLMELRLGDAKP